MKHLKHLSQEQIAAAMVEDDLQTAAHLRECAECAAKVERLRAALKDFGSFVHANTERNNAFWWRRRAAEPQRSMPLTRWAAAAAAVAIAIGASTTFLHKASRPDDDAKNKPVIQQPISDEALLSEVQNDVQREYADAFAPVQTNAESAVASQAHGQTSAKTTKEQKIK